MHDRSAIVRPIVRATIVAIGWLFRRHPGVCVTVAGIVAAVGAALVYLGIEETGSDQAFAENIWFKSGIGALVIALSGADRFLGL